MGDFYNILHIKIRGDFCLPKSVVEVRVFAGEIGTLHNL